MLLTSMALLLASAAIAGFFGMRALVGSCIASQRRRLREEAEVITNQRVRYDESAALLLPLHA